MASIENRLDIITTHLRLSGCTPSFRVVEDISYNYQVRPELCGSLTQCRQFHHGVVPDHPEVNHLIRPPGPVQLSLQELAEYFGEFHPDSECIGIPQHRNPGYSR